MAALPAKLPVRTTAPSKEVDTNTTLHSMHAMVGGTIDAD